ncbi:hypothetical protein D3C76_622820 [compost metagenome]
MLGGRRKPRIFGVALLVVGLTFDPQRLGCRLRLGVGGVEVGFFLAQEGVPAGPAGIGIELVGGERQSRIFAMAISVVRLTFDSQRLGRCLRLGVGSVIVGFFLAQEGVPVRPAGLGIDLIGGGRQFRVFAVALLVDMQPRNSQRLGCSLRLYVGVKILLYRHHFHSLTSCSALALACRSESRDSSSFMRLRRSVEVGCV